MFIDQVEHQHSAAMASTRSSVALLCVIALLLVADVAAQPELPQQQAAAQVTGSTTQFYLRGEVMSKLAENETGVEENLESFERRELSDYGSKPTRANCSGNCK